LILLELNLLDLLVEEGLVLEVVVLHILEVKEGFLYLVTVACRLFWGCRRLLLLRLG